MIATLLWKEYREQRGLWLAIAVLAVLLTVILAAVLGTGSLFGAFGDPRVRPTLLVLVYALAIAHGVVCGALLIAGDRETNTLSFLDVHVGSRWTLWRTKAVAGVGLCLSQGLLLAVLMLIFGGKLQDAAWLPLVALDALVWGSLGGAIGRNVLVSVLGAIGLAGASWVIALVAG